MTCLEIQGKITPFINGELDIKELEVFLEHISHCENCREELEVYYTLLTGMKQLDGDKNLSSDFHQDLKMELRHAGERIQQNKRSIIRKQIVLITTICIIALFSSISISEYVTEEIISPNKIKVSDFNIKNYYFRNKENTLNEYIEDNYLELQQHRADNERLFRQDSLIKKYIITDEFRFHKNIRIPK